MANVEPVRSIPAQNKTHAVMAHRQEPLSSQDDLLTSTWATHELVEHMLPDHQGVTQMTVLGPACGRGHIAVVLDQCFDTVIAREVHSYGYGDARDLLGMGHGQFWSGDAGTQLFLGDPWAL
jgi:hypothetical protein